MRPTCHNGTKATGRRDYVPTPLHLPTLFFGLSLVSQGGFQGFLETSQLLTLTYITIQLLAALLMRYLLVVASGMYRFLRIVVHAALNECYG